MPKANALNRWCHDCGAAVILVRTAASEGRKWMALDPRPNADGNVILEAASVAGVGIRTGLTRAVVVPPQEREAHPVRFMPHPATCRRRVQAHSPAGDPSADEPSNVVRFPGPESA